MLKEKLIDDFTNSEIINDLKDILNHHFAKPISNEKNLSEYSFEKEDKTFFDEYENVYILKYKNNEYQCRKISNGKIYIQNKNDTNDVSLYEASFKLENDNYTIQRVSFGKKNEHIQLMATIYLNNNEKFFYLNNNEKFFRYNYYDMIENESVSLMFDKNFELQVENSFEHINIQNPDGDIQKIQQFFEKISAINDPVLNKEIVKYLTQNTEMDVGYKDVLNIMHDISFDKQQFLQDYKIDATKFNKTITVPEIKEPKKLKI